MHTEYNPGNVTQLFILLLAEKHSRLYVTMLAYPSQNYCPAERWTASSTWQAYRKCALVLIAELDVARRGNITQTLGECLKNLTSRVSKLCRWFYSRLRWARTPWRVRPAWAEIGWLWPSNTWLVFTQPTRLDSLARHATRK